VATEWNYWVEVEKLAEDAEKIRKMSELFLEKKRTTFISFRDKWHNEVKEWKSIGAGNRAPNQALCAGRAMAPGIFTAQVRAALDFQIYR